MMNIARESNTGRKRLSKEGRRRQDGGKEK